MEIKLRICTKCGFIGPALTSFRKCEIGKEWNICKTCDAKRMAKVRLRDPFKHKIRVRNSKYKITSEYFDALLAKQDNKCAICHKVFTNETKYHQPWVDHDHSCCPEGRSCGKCIRGLLCAICYVPIVISF